MEYNTVFILPNSVKVAANSQFYSLADTGCLDSLYTTFGVYVFDIVNFERYSDKKFDEFFKEVKLVENKQFMDELCRILNTSSKPPTKAIEYVLQNVPDDIKPAYYRLFSQVSLLAESNFGENLEPSGNLIRSGITCDIISYLNDIELCCFFVRYCSRKETLLSVKNILCPETFVIVKARLSGAVISQDEHSKCSCKNTQPDVEPKKC